MAYSANSTVNRKPSQETPKAIAQEATRFGQIISRRDRGEIRRSFLLSTQLCTFPCFVVLGFDCVEGFCLGVHAFPFRIVELELRPEQLRFQLGDLVLRVCEFAHGCIQRSGVGFRGASLLQGKSGQQVPNARMRSDMTKPPGRGASFLTGCQNTSGSLPVSLRGRDPQHYFTVDAALPPKARRATFSCGFLATAEGSVGPSRRVG